MNGAMMRATSRFAIAAAAGVVLSLGSAKAADLGGNCCADLEERVAELEATTARKGNRKIALTISGQVSRSILFFDDGGDSRTFAGLENRVQSTRFVFSGTAKINPNVTAGFEIMTDIGLGAQTSAVSNAAPPGTANANGLNNVDGNWGGDSILTVRTANWWLEDKHLGRITVGRVNLGGPVFTIDLGGISVGATSHPALVGGGMQFRQANGALAGGGGSIGAYFGPVYGGDRGEGIRYDSASLGGLLVQAYWGENDVWSASLRYAGEFHGFQVAAGIGIIQDTIGTIDAGGATNTGGAVGASSQAQRAQQEWSVSLATKHVASGVFIQGHYAESDFSAIQAPSGKAVGSIFVVQGGVSKNWFGLGNTSPYIEYGKGKNQSANLAGGLNSASDADFWGLGVNQQIDAAAMEIFVGWRHFSADSNLATIVAGGGLQDLDLIHGGARVRF